MPPNINWDIVGSVAKGQGKLDDDTVDQLVEDLRDVQDDQYKDEPEKLVLLFKSVLNVLNFREQEFENLLDEQANSFAEKDSQIEDLRRRLDEEKRYDSGSRGTDFLRAENLNLAEHLESYKEQERELRIELEEVKSDKYRYERENEEIKRNASEMRRENSEMKADLREYRDIMENQQRDRLETKGHIDSEMRDKLNEKNGQISDLLTQVTQLEQLNKKLEESNHGVRDEMERAQLDMEKMADEYEKMKRVIDGTDHFSENIQKENAAFKHQVHDLREQLRIKNDEVDAIVGTVNAKVEEWKERMAVKDKALVENAKTISTLQERISSAALDQDRINAERLAKRLKEKEDQIKQLQTSLEQAINDLDAQTAIVQDLRKDSGTSREILDYKKQVRTLQEKIHQLEDGIKDAESHRVAAEEEARLKDQKLNDAIKRIGDIESGEYGLSDAVNEIKECRNQIKVRDENIEKLIKQLNAVEEKLNDILEENEEFRERLGVNPRDLSDIAKLRESRVLRHQQYRAENQILLKEIERLEDERIEMKKQIRSQAQTYSQKAMSEGLHQDDIELIDEYVEELKRKRKIGRPEKPKSVRLGSSQSMNWRMEELNRETERAEVKLQSSQGENARLMQERKSLSKENDSLKKAMREILEALKKSQAEETTSTLIEIPSLERLINLLEMRTISGGNESALHLKAQVDQLTGRNSELRQELRSTRAELAAVSGERANLKSKGEILHLQVETLTKLTEGKSERMEIRTIPLPENIDPSANDIITALNEQLMLVMNDVGKRDARVGELTESLERCRRQFNVLRHQNHLLYKEHLEKTNNLVGDKKKMEEERIQLQGKLEKNEVRLQELDRLLDSLQRDPDTVKQRLAETTRKISLLRVNEKTLIRRHKALEYSEETLNRENSRLKNEILLMEKAVADRIGYLERYKDMAAYKISALQKTVDASIPEVELDLANRKFDELTAKYRDLLQKENQFVAKNTKVDTLRTEVKILNDELSTLRTELGIEKEKRHTVEEALRRSESSTSLRSSGSSSKDAINHEISSVLKKVTVLEMKELNERQRAEHSSRMYNQIKSTVDSLENRNTELEQKFAELTRMNLNSQKTERELQDELAAAVPLAVSQADRKKISSLEEDAARMRARMSQVQDMSDIAQNQLKTVQMKQQEREREIRSLRQQVQEFQAQSDDNSLIGKLHRQILNLQATEAEQKLKLDKTSSLVKKLEAHVLKQEKLIDEKELMVYHVRTEATSRSRQLKKTIQSLRQQFSGALPLHQQEKFSQAMIRLQEDKALTQEELRRVRAEREKLEDKLAEADIKRESLIELKKTIQDGRGAKKLEEWCEKMDSLRLQDMKLQRQVVRQNEELSYLQNQSTKHEKTIAGLEEDIVQMLRAQEKQQLEWEQRETDLERMLDQFGMQQREVARKAKRMQDVTALLPDPTKPLDVQLTNALQTISKQVDSLKNVEGQLRFYKSDCETLKDRIHNLEGDVYSRDRIITELRMRIPQTSSAAAVKVVKSDLGLNTDGTQQLKIAMETIETLKKRLQQKEESLNRHRQLLEDSRQEHVRIIKSHEHELSSMQGKIHSKTDNAFERFRKVAMDAMVSKPSSAPTKAQLSRMSELEEIVREQDAAVATLMDRLRSANEDVLRQKQIVAETRRRTERDLNRNMEEQEHVLKKMRVELSNKERSVDEVEKELALTKTELERQKEANAVAPATTLKNLVSKLKTQLKEKEFQQQKLSQALMDLRADLVQQAQENIRAASEGESSSTAVQRVVQAKTASYRDEIEDLKDKLALMQKGVKQERMKQEKLKDELKQVLEETEKKEMVVRRLKNDKEKAEEENERLRDKIRRLANSKDGKTVKVTSRLTESSAPHSSRGSDDGDVRYSDPEQDVPEKLVLEEVVVPVETGKSDAPSSSRASKLPKATTLVYSIREASKSRKESELEEENKQLKKKVEDLSAPGKNSLEVAKWDIRKQWQGRVDSLRSQVQAKEKQIEVLNKQVSAMRDTISRLERDKLRRAGGGGAPIHAVGQVSETAISDKLARQERHNVEDLSRRLHELAEENSRLRRESVLPRNVVVAEMEAKNKNLETKLEDMQKELLISGLREERDLTTDQIRKERTDKLQSETLKLYSENAEIRFEIEQNKIDLPRLRDRIEDQQRYIDLLKAEKREAEMRNDKMRAGQPKRSQGTSGKSIVELEKMVTLMKKVVERVQRENETLKKAPGVVSNEIVDGLRKENAELKRKLGAMSKQIGGQLSSRYESKTLGVERLMKENEKLRNEIEKKNMALEKLRGAVSSDTGQELQHARTKITALEKANTELEGMLQRRTMQRDDDDGTALSKLKDLDSLNEKNSKLNTEMQLAYQENERLKEEVAKLKDELSNFNEDFFDEIEDLKYNYAEAVKRNVLFEEKLQKLGVDINLSDEGS